MQYKKYESSEKVGNPRRRNIRSAPPHQRVVYRNKTSTVNTHNAGEVVDPDMRNVHASNAIQELNQDLGMVEKAKSDGGRFDPKHFYRRFSRRVKEIDPDTVLGKMIREDPERAKRHGLKTKDKSEERNKPWPPPAINCETFKSKVRPCTQMWPDRRHHSKQQRKMSDQCPEPTSMRPGQTTAKIRRPAKEDARQQKQGTVDKNEGRTIAEGKRSDDTKKVEKNVSATVRSPLSPGSLRREAQNTDKSEKDGPQTRHTWGLRRLIASRLSACPDKGEEKISPDTTKVRKNSGFTMDQLTKRRDLFMSQHLRKPGEKEKYAQEFLLFDKDGNGHLDTQEVQKVMEKCGIQPKDKAEQKMYAEILAQVDDMASDDGWSLQDFLFFISLIEKKNYEAREEEIRQTAEELGIPWDEIADLRLLFRQLDTRGENAVHYFQLDSLLTEKLKLRDWDHQRALDFFHAQAGKDGRINFIQFLRLAKELDFVLRARSRQPYWMRGYAASGEVDA